MEKIGRVDWKKSYRAEAEKCVALTAELAALRRDNDALRERGERLEWLVEVQDAYMHRLRFPGGWAPVGCDRGLMLIFWARRERSNGELRDSYKAARAAMEGEQPTTAQDNIRRMQESMSMGQVGKDLTTILPPEEAV